MMIALRMLMACGLVAAGIPGGRAQTAPYAEFQNRGLKALSEQQLEDLRAGRGMALALAAEPEQLSGTGGRIRAGKRLNPSDEQRGRTQALFEEMRQVTVYDQQSREQLTTYAI